MVNSSEEMNDAFREKIFIPKQGTGNELKPCPFCGCSEIYAERYCTEVGMRYRVFCPECMAMIDPGCAQHLHNVTIRWNKRA